MYAAVAKRIRPSSSQPACSVATHIITTNRAKNSNEDPRSRWPTITSTANAQATAMGRRNRGSGRWNGPTLQPELAISSRCSAR